MSLNSSSDRGDDNGRNHTAYRGIFSANAVELGDNDESHREKCQIGQEERARRCVLYARVAAAKMMIPMDGHALAIAERLLPLPDEEAPAPREEVRLCQRCERRRARRGDFCPPCRSQILNAVRKQDRRCCLCDIVRNSATTRKWHLRFNGDRVCPDCVAKESHEQEACNCGKGGLAILDSSIAMVGPSGHGGGISERTRRSDEGHRGCQHEVGGGPNGAIGDAELA